MDHRTILWYAWDRVLERTPEAALNKKELDFFGAVLDETWDAATPHLAMELAQSIADHLPLHDARVMILRAVERWETRPNYQAECAKSSAKGCLRKALEKVGHGRKFPGWTR